MSQIYKVTCPELDNIPYITHGFFGTEGGVSRGNFHSLNCAYVVGETADRFACDVPEHVTENRRRVLMALDAPQAYFAFLKQVHGDQVHVIRNPSDVPIYQDGTSVPEGDGMVTNQSGIALGIFTADCAPVLFVSSDRPLIGACHAGWKGALRGVLQNMVHTLGEMGSQASALLAVIGPTIVQSSYEVGPDFYQDFMDKSPVYKKFFIPGNRTNHYQFDLPGFVQYQLIQLGVGKIFDLALDTFTGAFFSRRRSILSEKSQYGCGASVIMLR